MFKGKNYLEFVVLHALSKGKRNGYALIKHVEASTGTKPSPGSMYPLLTKLKKKKLVTVKEEGNKKTYSLTITGKKAYKLLQKNKHEFVQHMKGHINILESVTGHKHTDVKKMFDRLKFGKMPFLWLLADAVKLRKTLLGLVEKVKDTKKQEKVKKILRKTIKELKKV